MCTYACMCEGGGGGGMVGEGMKEEWKKRIKECSVPF